MPDNTPLLLEMVIYDPNNVEAEPIKRYEIRFHEEGNRTFMNKTAIWAWNSGYAVATKAIDKLSPRK